MGIDLLINGWNMTKPCFKNVQPLRYVIERTRAVMYYLCETQWVDEYFSRLLQFRRRTFRIIALSKRATRHVGTAVYTLTDPAYFFATIYSQRDIARITSRKFLFVKICYLIFDSGLCYVVESIARTRRNAMLSKREKFNRFCRQYCVICVSPPWIKISLIIGIGCE